ncbi:MAG: hypothetical protein IT342_23590 [Candidatus Melainabacteria bacterium]|nr:hypothetical protein [Candidatus Melainabacteria bacterium]
MTEAKEGGGSDDKGTRGKKPEGKESDSKKEQQKESVEPIAAEEAPEAKTSEEPDSKDQDTKESAAEAAAPEAAKPEVASSSEPNAPTAKPEKMQQQHVSRILDAVLEEPVEESSSHHGFKHPLFLDVILAAGLLVAMAGFSIGMFKIYITHSAKQSINQQNYHAAIVLLKGTPLPGFFNIAGSEDTLELLNRALYLDAISKLEINREDQSALDELQQIRPGSGYFELAQDLLRDNSPPPKLQLEGGATHDADPSDPEIKEEKPIMPDDDPKDASP